MSWKTVKLEKLCKMNSGGTPSRSIKEYYSGDIPWAKISDIEAADGGIVYSTEEHITKDGLNAINNRIFEKGTLLLAMYGSVGKVAFTGVDMSTNQAILGIRIIDETILDYSYLRYWFQTIKSKLLDRAVGGTLQNISLGIVKDLEIPLPPLATQKRIAEILDASDALRRKDQELLKKYDELAQAIFINMFGDPVKNEKGWDVKKGRDVVKVLGGAAFKSTDYKDDGIPLIRIGTINKGYFDKSQIVFLPYDFAISHERYIVRPKDLLITLTGTVGKDDYGNVYVMEEHFNQYLLNQRVAKLVVNQDCLMTRFFEFLLKQKEIKSELTGVSRGVRQANISNEDIYNLDVITPPIALQNDFVNRINSVYGQIETSSSSSLVSDILFNSLIQKAFKGELVA